MVKFVSGKFRVFLLFFIGNFENVVTFKTLKLKEKLAAMFLYKIQNIERILNNI